MRTIEFTLKKSQLSLLLKALPKQGNNSDIGKIPIEVVKYNSFQLISKQTLKQV